MTVIKFFTDDVSNNVERSIDQRQSVRQPPPTAQPPSLSMPPRSTAIELERNTLARLVVQQAGVIDLAQPHGGFADDELGTRSLKQRLRSAHNRTRRQPF